MTMTKFTGGVTEMFMFRENGYTVAMAFATKIVEIQWLPLTKIGFLMDIHKWHASNAPSQPKRVLTLSNTLVAVEVSRVSEG
jgi:hypothetical protein